MPPGQDIRPERRCAFLSKVQSVDQRMRLECGVGFRQLRTCRRTRPGQLWAISRRMQLMPPSRSHEKAACFSALTRLTSSERISYLTLCARSRFIWMARRRICARFRSGLPGARWQIRSVPHWPTGAGRSHDRQKVKPRAQLEWLIPVTRYRWSASLPRPPGFSSYRKCDFDHRMPGSDSGNWLCGIVATAHDRFWQILLQKCFWGDERKFLASLMRLTRGDVRGPYRFIQN